MKLTARFHFSASHRLVSDALSAEENARLYGKCNYPFGHGHDYVLDVTIEGRPDASGQIVNRGQLNRWICESVIEKVDHRNLNTDVPELDGQVTTTENLAVAIEGMLKREWPFQAALAGVRISETARNTFELPVPGIPPSR